MKLLSFAKRGVQQMLPSWDSLPELEDCKAWYDFIVSTGTITVAFLALIGVTVNQYISRVEKRIDELRAEQAAAVAAAESKEWRERTELAEAQLDLLARRALGRLALLTPEKQQQLIEAAKKLPPDSVHVLSLHDSDETVSFAKQLSKCMQASGCFAEMKFATVFPPMAGVLILHDGNHNIDGIVDVLRSCGLENVNSRVTDDRDGGHPIVIKVGRSL